MRSTVASAPGKVLLTGGYLVTERPNAGAVLTVDARFHAVIRTRSSSMAREVLTITTASPQFQNSARVYQYTWNPRPQLQPDHGNPFVEIGLLYGLALVQERIGTTKLVQQAGAGINIVLLADNPFYSQTEHLKEGMQLSDLPRFQSSTLRIEQMKKTGLGSSAALVTSLCGALLHHFGVTDVRDTNGQQILHRVAQYCHCLAQNSIGSGFDVAAATFGTQLYTRFDPSCLHLAPLEEARRSVASPAAIWAELLSPAWNAEHLPFRLPRSLRLLLGDVNEGSKTPGMVRLVQKWKAALSADALARSPWSDLQRLNAAFAAALNALAQLDRTDGYAAAMRAASKVAANEWSDGEVHSLLKQLRTTFVSIRAALRQMGTEAGSGSSFIEPHEQTFLADATMAIPGVLLAGVPGAGGKDAIVALVLSKEAEGRVKDFWRSRGVVALPVNADARGIRIHPFSSIPDHLVPSVKDARL